MRCLAGPAVGRQAAHVESLTVLCWKEVAAVPVAQAAEETRVLQHQRCAAGSPALALHVLAHFWYPWWREQTL